MNTKLWMKVALVMLVLTLVPVALVSAAGKVNIERKPGTAILGVPPKDATNSPNANQPTNGSSAQTGASMTIGRGSAPETALLLAAIRA